MGQLMTEAGEASLRAIVKRQKLATQASLLQQEVKPFLCSNLPTLEVSLKQGSRGYVSTY